MKLIYVLTADVCFMQDLYEFSGKLLKSIWRIISFIWLCGN
jgi:hypothetical protein